MRHRFVQGVAALFCVLACSGNERGGEPESAGTGGTSSAGQPGTGGTAGSAGANAAGTAAGGKAESGGAAGSAPTAGTTGGTPPAGGAAGQPSSGAGGSSAGASGAGGSAAGSSSGGAGGTAGSAGSEPSGGSAGSAGGEAGSGGGPASRCEESLSLENEELVGKAIDELFVQKDITAADRYWADPYLQHNPIATSGVATFRSLMGQIVGSSGFSYQRLRTVGECDLVVVQGRYSQTGVIFDMFRVKDGKIMEHWDSDTNQASDASGPSEIDGNAPTQANRALVLAFLDAVLIQGNDGDFAEFLAESYVEHRETSESGPRAFVEYVTEDEIRYSQVHHAVARGNFVFTLSEGTRRGQSFGFYDLFRVEDGYIVEHWDSRRQVPASTQSGLPIF